MMRSGYMLLLEEEQKDYQWEMRLVSSKEGPMLPMTVVNELLRANMRNY